MAVRESDRGSGLDVRDSRTLHGQPDIVLAGRHAETNTRENSSPSWIFAGMLSLGLSSHSSNHIFSPSCRNAPPSFVLAACPPSCGSGGDRSLMNNRLKN